MAIPTTPTITEVARPLHVQRTHLGIQPELHLSREHARTLVMSAPGENRTRQCADAVLTGPATMAVRVDRSYVAERPATVTELPTMPGRVRGSATLVSRDACRPYRESEAICARPRGDQNSQHPPSSRFVFSPSGGRCCATL